MLNLPRHLLSSVFGRSEFHGKLVCKTHGPIAVFFCQVSRRSNLRNDGLSCAGPMTRSDRVAALEEAKAQFHEGPQTPAWRDLPEP